MTKLSIILPCYNVEKYIAECLDSLYAQDIPESEYEVICVNDCSPDNSRKIILDYQKKHPNLILIDHEVNKRQGGARNTGLRAAKGDYIWFVDADDKVKENCLNDLLTILYRFDIEIISFNYYEQSENGEYIPKLANFKLFNHTITGVNFLETNYRTLDLSPWSKQIKRSYLIENELFFEEGVYWEDADFLIKVFFQAKSIYVIEDCLYYYTYNQASTTKQKNIKLCIDSVKVAARKLTYSYKIYKTSPKVADFIKNDAYWNASAVKKIILFNLSDRLLFYNSIDYDEYKLIKTTIPSITYRVLFNYKKISNLIITFLHPLIWTYKFIRKLRS